MVVAMGQACLLVGLLAEVGRQFVQQGEGLLEILLGQFGPTQEELDGRRLLVGNRRVLAHRGVVVVERRLMGVEAVPVVLLGDRVVRPVRGLEVGEDDAGVGEPLRRLGPGVVVPFDRSGSGAAGAGETTGAAATSEEADNRVSGLWWWVMLVLTITALAEVAVASGYLGTQREAV